jgi:DNA polymerase III subunit delta'
MLFSRVKGHGEILSGFEKSVGSHSFEGVYLFTGPCSVGKLTIARQLSKYLLCTGLVDDTCRCESCRLHPHVPDYFEISKNDENILVSDVEALIEFVSLVPYRSDLRVAIIDNAHNINPTASNNLLKTLEDLKSNCLVILVTSYPERLLPTLVSRCYEVSFGPLKTEDIIAILKSKGHDTGKLSGVEKMIPYMTGNVLVDFGKYVEYVRFVPQFVRDVLSMKEDDISDTIKGIDEKQELQFFVETLIIYLNDIMKFRGGSLDAVLNVSKLDDIEKVSTEWKEDLCIFMLDKLKNVHGNMKKNLNLKQGQYVLPVFLWLHYFLQKEKASRESK